MDGERFDGVARARAGPGAGVSRRAACRLLAGGALAGALARLGLAEAAAAKCRKVGRPCRRKGQCCSGRCCPFPTGFCAPKNSRCCPEAQGGGACPDRGLCCPATATKPGGFCCAPDRKCCALEGAESCCPDPDGACCTAAEGGGCCPAGTACCLDGAGQPGCCPTGQVGAARTAAVGRLRGTAPGPK
jgi:hypothetical protein